MERRYDFLIVGSGIAGLFFALKVSQMNPNSRVAIVTKKGETDTSTNRAQGGIAAVTQGTDSFEAHVADTLKAGAGLCDKEVVEKIVEAAPSVIKELVDFGVRFTRSDEGFHLGREGGHSAPRVVHAQDLTGREIERALLKACRSMPNVDIFRDHMVLELITYEEAGRRYCGGGFVFCENDREFSYFYAPVTMLATGGLGQIYYHSTNPKIATGDGVALAYRAGIPVSNLEFTQFHPTTLYTPGRWPFLISEAVRGEGARLYSVSGRRFMEGAHEQQELAPRDIVARAIDREIKETGEEYVLLDISHVDADRIKSRFPNIYAECLRRGFDMTERAIPVVPAAHYACGGVVSSISGETEMPGLYTAGEVAMTGMHGANRLASNSLLEAVVMARFAADRSSAYVRDIDFPEHIPAHNLPASSLRYPRQKILIAHDKRQLNRVMSDFVGIVRRVDHLELALERVQQIREAINQYYFATPVTQAIAELRNMATVAELMIKAALWRHESRGLHYIEDYPETKEEYARNSIFSREEDDDH
ncbi:MAG TPA: L-aspartate oxidase [candidate division Zixibacteria bacterium]|nr:L-aspartate oxidase [candidate division Zixibacteria bacterium]